MGELGSSCLENLRSNVDMLIGKGKIFQMGSGDIWDVWEEIKPGSMISIREYSFLYRACCADTVSSGVPADFGTELWEGVGVLWA